MVIVWICYLMAVQCWTTCVAKSWNSGIILDLLLLPSLVMMSDVAVTDELAGDLSPYLTHHGPLHRTHRDTQACQSVVYGNVTHTKYPAHVDTQTQLPLVETHYMVKEVGTYAWEKKMVTVNHQVVSNPLTTWSVLEPEHPGTCQNGTAVRATVEVSAQQKECLVASNAGFFNTHSGECLGNIVSDGFLIQDSGGIQNVHFGVTRDNYIFTGYLSELDLLIQDFTQLVGGVIWLVRDGQKYVDESKSIECAGVEETGTIERFIGVVSARTAVGHDAEGRIHMVQVGGKSDVSGMDLYQFSDLLIELGLVNAINLDGGGSATTVINGTLVSYPSDHCTNSSYNCPRKVSTILCVHQPSCSPSDCSGHGSCEKGVCQCQGHWTGSSCDKLDCPNDCSWHGHCTQDGCLCHPGWQAGNCSLTCDEGWYGINCSLPCRCEAQATCSPVTGDCKCSPGYTGRFCQSVCPVGYFGQNCREICVCNDSCLCDHVSGRCNVTVTESRVLMVGRCLARQEIKRKRLVPDQGEQYDVCVASLLGISVFAVVSLIVNVLLTYFFLRSAAKHQRVLDRGIRLAAKNAAQGIISTKADSETDDEDDDIFKIKNKKTAGTLASAGDEEINLTGSGDDEDDLFLAPKKVKGRVK